MWGGGLVDAFLSQRLIGWHRSSFYRLAGAGGAVRGSSASVELGGTGVGFKGSLARGVGARII